MKGSDFMFRLQNALNEIYLRDLKMELIPRIMVILISPTLGFKPKILGQTIFFTYKSSKHIFKILSWFQIYCLNSLDRFWRNRHK